MGKGHHQTRLATATSYVFSSIAQCLVFVFLLFIFSLEQIMSFRTGLKCFLKAKMYKSWLCNFSFYWASAVQIQCCSNLQAIVCV